MLRDHEAEIIEMYRAGMTLQQIGDRFGVTREAVRLVCPLTRKDGGQYVRSQNSKRDFNARRDERTMAKHGCSWDQYKFLLAMGKGTTRAKRPLGAFTKQRANAYRRGIAWELKLWDWWLIWDASGKWSQRGRGDSYVMARKGDTGPYSVDNVYITTASQNIKDSYIFKPYHTRNVKSKGDTCTFRGESKGLNHV